MSIWSIASSPYGPNQLNPDYSGMINAALGRIFNKGGTTPTTTAGTTGPGTSLTPAAPAAYSSPYGGIPQVPSPASSAAGALNANIANAGDAIKLANILNDFNYSQTIGQLMKTDPNYLNNTAKISANLGTAARGVVNPDVQYNIGQAAAERGVSRGGQLTDADYLRALGLTSKGIQDQAAKDYVPFVGSLPRTQLYDPSKNFISPNDVYNSQLLANTLAAAPVPADRAAAEFNRMLAGLRAGYGQTAPTRGMGTGGGSSSSIDDILAKYLGRGAAGGIQPSTPTGGQTVTQPPYTDQPLEDALQGIYQDIYGGGDLGIPNVPMGGSFYGPNPYDTNTYDPYFQNFPVDLNPAIGDYGYNGGFYDPYYGE